MKTTATELRVHHQDDRITLEFTDTLSGVRFHSMEIPVGSYHEAFCRNMTGRGSSTITVTDKVGLQREYMKFEFPTPPDIEDYYSRGSITEDYVKEQMDLAGYSEWEPDMYFQSQDSFFTNMEKCRMARTTIRRWVEPTSTDEK